MQYSYFVFSYFLFNIIGKSYFVFNIMGKSIKGKEYGANEKKERNIFESSEYLKRKKSFGHNGKTFLYHVISNIL